jgi:hypothetical protein
MGKAIDPIADRERRARLVAVQAMVGMGAIPGAERPMVIMPGP